jgi:hypothetical protein
MMSVNEAALVLAGLYSFGGLTKETTECQEINIDAMRWHISLATSDTVPAPATAKKPTNTITLGSGHQISEVAIQ